MGDPIDCREAKERLTDYLKQELTDDLAVEVHQHLVRCRSCFGRAKFEEMLERYAAGEDWDISERIRDQGLIAYLPPARQCHLEAPGGRLSKRTVSELRYLNYMALHVVHSEDVSRSRRMQRRMMWRRVVSDAMSDLIKRQWRLPRAREAWAALGRMPEMFGKSADEMRRWYPELQRRIIAADSGEDGAR